ncbi:polysaccharide deacetylase family protein [Enterococcus sp.]|uniref:polysaccharide deacetylase family protein n=1 Tax=Enterococcus sp. TaxID=35783 RepID=UPI002FCC00DE
MNELEPIELRSERRERRKKEQKHYQLLKWGIPLLFLFVLLIGGFSIKRFFDQQALEAQINAEKQVIIESSQKAQKQSGFETIKNVKERRNITQIIYSPKEKDTFPIADFSEKSKKMMDDIMKKQKTKEPIVLVAGLGTTSYTEHLGAYHIQVDTYQWQINKNNFEKIATKTDSPLYINQKTGKPVTSKELIAEDANLLGIHQVIQQQILDEAKDPKKIMDAVLDLPVLNWESKITYAPEELKITLQKNDTGVTKISLPYQKIRPFIQQNLVNPAVFTEDVPALDPNKKYIALTFDDGPSAATTPKVLKVLADKKVKSTFFLLGQNAKEYPELVQQIQKDGHEIASHSYSHPQLTSLTADQVTKEVRETDKAIFKATGILPRTFRPPYGAVNPEVAKAIGKPVIQWDIDSLDWQSKNTHSVIEVVKQTSHPGGIVLMHDIQQSTADGIATIIDNLKSHGYEFLTIEEMFQLNERPLYQYFGLENYRKI